MSDQLIRLTYASRANFKLFGGAGVYGIDKNVAQILSIARINNKKNNLVGALYYGNGCFFQCLEGKKQDIDALYAKLEKDLRHTELKVLSVEQIEHFSFLSWEMKYALVDKEVRSFLRDHNIAKFDPYRFTPEMTAELIAVLMKADEGIADDQLEELGAGEILSVSSRVSMTMFWLAIVVSILTTALITRWVVSS
ncbi:MAG: BLUF domain-containing protein [Candidatus Saccharibacteria bacterium]|nr:BLUF domain-containing protein [Moraxellaceae bacterium]